MTTVLIVAIILLPIILTALLMLNHHQSKLLHVDLKNQVNQLSLNMDQKSSSMEDKTSKMLENMNQKIHHHMEKTVDFLSKTQHITEQKLDQNQRVFGELSNKLGQLEKANQQIQDLGKNMMEMQMLLKSPKTRGTLGEQGLENILASLLPKAHFALQHSFGNGLLVDAAILLNQNKIVCIDSKFPFTHFKQMMDHDPFSKEFKSEKKLFVSNVKKHIDDIAKKYIRPDLETMDFAMMYLPSENIYYETIIKDDVTESGPYLYEYALNKRVIPVSPNSFFAYLQAIVLGLKGLQIEARAGEIAKGLSQLKQNMQTVFDDVDKLGKHLSNATSAFVRVEKGVLSTNHQIDHLELHDSPKTIAKG